MGVTFFRQKAAKELPFLDKRICLQYGRPGFDPWVGKIPWRRAWQLTLVFLPGESQGQRGLAGYNPWGHKELDMTERLSTAHSVSEGIHESTPHLQEAFCDDFRGDQDGGIGGR